jgi:tetratricopeptide (TPR) repeat protein
LPDNLRRFLLLHRSHALRVAGRYAEAAEDFAALANGADGYAADAAYWVADYSFLDGRFDEALAALDTLTDSTQQLRGEVLRLRGHVQRVNGLFAAAEGHYRAALALGRETTNLAAVGKALTDLVQTLSWRRPADVTDLHAEGVEVNTHLRNHVELVKLHAAFAVTAANLSEFHAAENEIRSGIRLADACGYRGGLIWCWAAAAFSQLRRGNRDGYIGAVEHVVAVTEEVGGNRFWADIACWWAGVDDRADSAAHWIGGMASARQRWRSVLDDRSSHG